MLDRCLRWGVNRVILADGRLLPVFPWKRTSLGPVAMSQKCQERKSDATKRIDLYLAARIFPVAGLRLSCADKSSRTAGSAGSI